MDPTLDTAGTDFQVMEPPMASTPAAPVAPPETLQFHETREGKLLSTLIDELERPDQNTRNLMMMFWRKMENYWRDRQYIIWDEFAQDWRTPEEVKKIANSIDIDPAAYAKVVNVYKPHGEAIISALSSGLPYVKYMPDDADIPEDVFAAKAFSRIAELIQRRNKGQLLFIRALFLMYNFGTVFAYNENRDTTQFGTIKRDVYDDVPVTMRQMYCPSCGYFLGSEEHDLQEPTDQVPGMPGEPPPTEQMPGQEPMSGPETGQMPGSVQSANGLPPPMQQECPGCGQMVQPDSETYDDIVPRVTGQSEDPKTHEFIEIFSGQNVKVPHWVTQQSQTPYLTLETEEHYALLRDTFPEIADKIVPVAAVDTFDRQARTNQDYSGDSPQHLATLKRSWIRPWAFNLLAKDGQTSQTAAGMTEEEDDVAYLKKLYPEGCYFVKINDIAAEAMAEGLDDHWTITKNPLSNYLHADPLAQSLVPIQDILNELSNLTLETIEFGIPETFYDPEAIESDQYAKSEARPGMMYPAKPRNQMGLDSSFHTVKTSALSQEVEGFAERMNQFSQFVVGAMPTIWGGALEGSGGTAKEVEQSRAAALQRLNLTWTDIKVWWAELMSKSVRSFAVNLKDDEKYVEKKGNSYINVWIRRAELTGKVGAIEPEINEAFPISWAQKRDILMGLINLKNPLVDAVIAHPENAGTVATTIGFPELYIPGDDARNKQLWEISQLVQAQPMVLPGMPPTPEQPQGGPEQFQPTIQVEEWELHPIESETCKAWLMSEVGIDAKQTNPGGYMNVVAHMQMHDQFVQQAQAQEAAMAAQGDQNGPESSKTGGSSEASGN
jgi:hypothetical protein